MYSHFTIIKVIIYVLHTIKSIMLFPYIKVNEAFFDNEKLRKYVIFNKRKLPKTLRNKKKLV